jgi:hypothetical protein
MQRNARVFQKLPPGVGCILGLCAVEFRRKAFERSKRVNVRISAAKKLDKLMTKCSVVVWEN